MNGFVRPRFAPTYVGYVFSARDIFSLSPARAGERVWVRGSPFFSHASPSSPRPSSMGWRRGRRGTLNSYYLGDYHPVAADVSPRKTR